MPRDTETGRARVRSLEKKQTFERGERTSSTAVKLFDEVASLLRKRPREARRCVLLAPEASVGKSRAMQTDVTGITEDAKGEVSMVDVDASRSQQEQEELAPVTPGDVERDGATENDACLYLAVA